MVEAVGNATDAIVSPKDGSYLDYKKICENEVTDTAVETADLINTMRTHYGSRETLIHNISPQAQSIKDAISVLRELKLDPTLMKLHSQYSYYKLEERSKEISENKILDTLYAISEMGYKLAHLEDKSWTNLATGRQAFTQKGKLPSPLKKIETVWLPKQLEQWESNLHTTIESLNLIIYLIQQTKYLRKHKEDVPFDLRPYELDKLSKKIDTSRNELMDLIRGNSFFDEFKKSLVDRKKALDKLINDTLNARLEEASYISASSIANFETRARQYISADLGFLYAPRSRDVYPYFGVNLYLIPVNKEASLRSFTFGKSIWRRTALMIGVTAISVEKEGKTEDLLSNRSLVLGIGVRLTDTIRLSGGALIFREVYDTGLSEDTKLTNNGFVSLSIDWDVRTGFGGLWETVFKN